VRQARVHQLVDLRGHDRRHDHHAQQVGAEGGPGSETDHAHHGKRHGATDHGELPAVHERQ
jgi:hypothetical protein